MAQDNVINKAARSIWVILEKKVSTCIQEQIVIQNWRQVIGTMFRFSVFLIVIFSISGCVSRCSPTIEISPVRPSKTKRWMERLYNGESATDGEVLVLNHRSCEMIADELYEKISQNTLAHLLRLMLSKTAKTAVPIYYSKPRC